MKRTRYSKQATYRITYEAYGITTTKNYSYIGRDKYKQIVFRPVMERTDEFDIALNGDMRIEILK